MARTATSAAAASPERVRPRGFWTSGRVQWLAAGVVAAPDLLGVAVAGFSIGPMLLLIANHFVPALALISGLLGAAIAVCWYGQPHRAVPGSDIVWTLLAMLFAYFWIVGNAHYAGENVYAIRDPSTYAIAGRWLMDHHSMAIHAHPEIFGEPSTVAGVESGGFNATHHIPVLYAQGNHLLPVALGLAGFCFGQSALFSANIVFGGLALFVFFGLARRVLRSGGLALLAMVALGLTVPMVYVARDTFSEPLTMLFLTGGLSLVYRAAQSRRPRDFALAAFVGACSAMLRIDSYASLIGFVAAAAMVCVVAAGADRRRAALCAVAAVAGGAGPTVIGWMDVAWLSRQYYWSQHANITALIKLLILLVVALPVLVAASWWTPVRRVLTRPSTRRVVARAAIGGLLLAFAILVSRPWVVPARAEVGKSHPGKSAAFVRTARRRPAPLLRTDGALACHVPGLAHRGVGGARLLRAAAPVPRQSRVCARRAARRRSGAVRPLPVEPADLSGPAVGDAPVCAGCAAGAGDRCSGRPAAVGSARDRRATHQTAAR